MSAWIEHNTSLHWKHNMICLANLSISLSYNSLFSVWFDVFYLDPPILPHTGRDQVLRLASSKRSKTFSIELHKANLLGLEVQYYPYPAPLSPFPGPGLAQIPKLPAQMWPPGPQLGSVAAPPASGGASSSSSAAMQPTSVSLSKESSVPLTKKTCLV